MLPFRDSAPVNKGSQARFMYWLAFCYCLMQPPDLAQRIQKCSFDTHSTFNTVSKIILLRLPNETQGIFAIIVGENITVYVVLTN